MLEFARALCWDEGRKCLRNLIALLKQDTHTLSPCYVAKEIEEAMDYYEKGISLIHAKEKQMSIKIECDDCGKETDYSIYCEKCYNSILCKMYALEDEIVELKRTISVLEEN